MARVQGTALYVQLVGTPTARGRSKDQGHCRTCIELRLLPTKLVAEAYVSRRCFQATFRDQNDNSLTVDRTCSDNTHEHVVSHTRTLLTAQSCCGCERATFEHMINRNYHHNAPRGPMHCTFRNPLPAMVVCDWHGGRLRSSSLRDPSKALTPVVSSQALVWLAMCGWLCVAGHTCASWGVLLYVLSTPCIRSVLLIQSLPDAARPVAVTGSAVWALRHGAMHKWAGPTVAGDFFAVQALGRARVGSRR